MRITIAEDTLAALKFKIESFNELEAKAHTLTSRAKDRVGVIDLLAHDTKTDEILLVMNEPRPWNGSDARLHELQERFNAYVSFLLDGEMASEHPELVGKRARIEVRCAHLPDKRAVNFLGLIHDQLAFQDIRLEVVVKGRGGSPNRPGD